MAEKYIRTQYKDGTVVLSNLRKKRNTVPVFGSNETYSATKVTQWYDGTVMTPEKADGSVYLQLKDTDEYFRVNLPNWGEIFLEKDTMAQMRALTPTEILLLKVGYYKGVKLNGYYEEGDTPASIDYYISLTSANDDGGSVIEVGGVKLEHEFTNYIHLSYYGAVGNGSNETLIIQKAINKGAELKLYVVGDVNKKYKVSKVSSTGYSVGSSTNYIEYSLVMPSFTKIQSIRLENLSTDYCSILINKGLIDGGGVINEGIELDDIHFFTNNSGTHKNDFYNPSLFMIRVKNCFLDNIITNNSYDSGVRILNADNIHIGSIKNNNPKGNGTYLGITPVGGEDLRVRNSYIGLLEAYNIEEYSGSASANPFIGAVYECNFGTIIAKNSAMGFKFQDDSGNVNISNVTFDGGVLSTQNSGLKIQGLSDELPIKNINVANVYCKNCKGAGLYIQYADAINIANYIGNNNGQIGQSDVWIHKKNITIGSIQSTNSPTGAVQIRPNSENIVIDKIIADNITGNVVIDSGQSSYIGKLIVNKTNSEIATTNLYSGQSVTSKSRVNTIIKKFSGTNSVAILSDFVRINEMILNEVEPLDFIMNLTAGSRTDILSENILSKSNGAGKNIRPFVDITQISGSKIDFTSQQYITGGYRLNHATTPIGDEKIKVRISNVHLE